MHHPSIPNYRLLELIGEGGYGLVYKAQQNNTGQLVAIKILKTNQGQQKSSHQQARFERETQLCAQINHPHIVKLLDKGHTHEGDLFAVFEYIAGQTLKERITQQEGLSVLEASTLMGQVLDALVCAHEQGIVHRDLKPQNIMITHTGATPHIKVLDFGIGTFIYDYRAQDYKSLTLTKEMVGTPSYSAPEQLRGEPPTIKSDIYAWGLILVECLTGETVIQGDSIAEIFQQQLHATNVPLPPAILGHPIADLLRRVLDKNARTRSGDALKLHEEYKQINFNTLVGKIAQTSTSPSPESNDTQSNEFELVATGNTKRQITMLCLRLGLVLPSNCLLETELLDSLQKDQLNICQDIAIRYGGYIAGTFADTVGVYFGYPKVSDNDARRAGRTALELISDTQKRSTLLQAQYGIGLDIRMSLHTGQVLTRANQVPEGLSLNIALHLLNETQQQAILVSDTARKLLDPYLEFGNPTTYHFLNTTKPLQGYPLLGERQTEALSFLRPWSANRLMIGREQERQKVLSTWQHIQPGKSAALLVSGQAGIGKSKLIYEAKKQLRDEGYLVRECRCLLEHTNNALFPFLDMLRKQWKLQENDRDHNIACLEEVLKAAQCSVKTTLPILCSWLAIPLNEAYEVSQDTPEKQKEILLNTLEKLLMNLHPQAKFLLIIEDLHWLDPTSQAFLERLLDHLPSHHYLLLMTTRPHFQIQNSYTHLDTIELQPLAQGFVKNMVEEVLGGKPATEKMVGYIAERADGIPLFVEELTRMLQDQGYLVLEDGAYQLDHRLNTDLIPITLKDLLNARLDGLGFAKETAQLAATIGRNFDYDLLVQSSIRDAASVQADLNQLMNADLIYRQRKVQNEGYIFRHALIRDAAYDSMTKALQKDTHGRIATTLEDAFPQVVEENPFEVARHFAGGELFEPASQYGIQMMKKQVSGSANAEAIATGEWTLAQIRKIDHETNQWNQELKMRETLSPAEMTVYGFGSNEAKAGLDRTKELKEKLKLDTGAWTDSWKAFLNYHYTAQRAKARQLGEQLLQQAIEDQDTIKEMVVLGHLAQCEYNDGDIEQSVESFKKSIELFEQANLSPTEETSLTIEYGAHPKGQGLGLIAQPLMHLGRIEEAFEYIRQGIEYAEKIGHETSIVFAYILKALVPAFCGHEEGIEAAIAEFNQKHHSKKDKLAYYTQFMYIFDYCRLGQFAPAEECINLQLESGQVFAVDWYVIELIKAYLRVGNIEQASSIAERTHHNNLQNKIQASTCFVKKALATCYYAQDQQLTPRVVQLLQEALEYAQQQKARFFELDILLYHAQLQQAHSSISPEIISQLKELTQNLTGHPSWTQYHQAQQLVNAFETNHQRIFTA